jgi:hypothetical protein
MMWRFRRKKREPAQLDFGFLDTIEEEFAHASAPSAALAATILNKSRLESATYSDERGSLTLNGTEGVVTISTPDAESAQNVCSMPSLEGVTMFANVRDNRLVVSCVSRSWQYVVRGIVSTAEGVNQCE